LQSRASPSPTSKTDVAVFINFEDLVRHVQGRKVKNQKLHQVPVPTHPRSMNLNTRTRIYGKKTLSDVQSEISFGQIAAPE
jgi:hypothetical protein